jgi:hypothetical protein
MGQVGYWTSATVFGLVTLTVLLRSGYGTEVLPTSVISVTCGVLPFVPPLSGREYCRVIPILKLLTKLGA